MKENLASTSLVMLCLKFSTFFAKFNEKIGRMISSGLIKYWIDECLAKDSEAAADVGPQVLTIDHFEVGFYVCFIPMVFGAFAFIAEIIKPRLSDWWNKLMWRI